MSIKLNAQSGGSVALDAPTQTTGNANLNFKLPVADGSAGQVLKTDGSGNLSWVTLSSDFVKLSGATGTNLNSALIFDNLDTATYRAFKLYFAVLPNSTADGYYNYLRFRTGGASGADDATANYSFTYSYGYQNDGSSTIARIDNTQGGVTHTVGSQAAVEGMSGVIDVVLCRSGDGFNTGGGGSFATGQINQHNEVENWRGGYFNIQYNNSSTVNHTGFKLYTGSGGTEVGGYANYKYTLYGLKG